MDYGTGRFRRRFVGYDRAAVDMEFEKLLSQVDEAMDRNDELRREIQDLKEERRDWEHSKRAMEEERTAMSRDRAALAESVTSITGKVTELETSLSSAKAVNEALQNKVDATAAERSQLQLRLDTVQERNRELTLRERQFDEIEKSVSSIMSVTKRATDRLFQKSVENQENVIRIAGDAAQEAALIRADLTAARDDMNLAFDEFQDRIDRIDASLTGAVHKLVAIKHDSGLKPKNADATIENEVERLLSLRAGEVDYSDGKGYAVPVLGPYSAKFISDAAKKVNAGEADGHPASEHYDRSVPPHAAPDPEAVEQGKPGVKKAYPSMFESSEESIKEANKLLDAADDAAEKKSAVASSQPVPPQPQPAYYYQGANGQPVYQPYQAQPMTFGQPHQQPVTQNPIGFGYTEEPEQPEQPSSEPPINPYAGDGFEQVDMSTLSNGMPTINMNTPELQYIQPQQPSVGAYDAPAVQVDLSQPPVTAANAAAYEYAGAQPSFLPNTPEATSTPPSAPVAAETAPAAAEAAPVSAETEEPVAEAKRVGVTKRTRSIPAEKVRIVVRHGR